MEVQKKPMDREPQGKILTKTLETAAVLDKPTPATGRLRNPVVSTVPSLPPQQTSKGEDEGEILKEGEEGGGEGEQKGVKPPSYGSATLVSPTAAAAAKAAESGPFAHLQKKLLRAERFGMPVQLSEEEKKNSRAERFGIGSTLRGSSEEKKRKARAERFGVATQSATDEEAKKARLARFSQDPKPDNWEEEKRQARAIRFSQTKSITPSQTNGKAISEQKMSTKSRGGS